MAAREPMIKAMSARSVHIARLGPAIDCDLPIPASRWSSIRAGVLIRSSDPAVLGPSGEFVILENLAHLSDAVSRHDSLLTSGFRPIRLESPIRPRVQWPGQARAFADQRPIRRWV